MVLQMLLFLILCLSCWNSYFSSLSFSSSIIGNTTRSEMSWRVKIIFFSKIWSAYLLFIVVSGQIWDLQPIAMSNPSSPFSPVHTYKRTIGWRFYDWNYELETISPRNPRNRNVGNKKKRIPDDRNIG